MFSIETSKYYQICWILKRHQTQIRRSYFNAKISKILTVISFKNYIYLIVSGLFIGVSILGRAHANFRFVFLSKIQITRLFWRLKNANILKIRYYVKLWELHERYGVWIVVWFEINCYNHGAKGYKTKCWSNYLDFTL